MVVLSLLKQVDTGELRKHCESRRLDLEERRRPWLDFCRAVAEELMPSRLPYLLDPAGNQRGGEQNTHVVDAVGHLSLDTAAAGITSASMPSSTPWFRLLVRDLFSEDDELQGFLEHGESVCLAMHNQSNAPHVLPECQKEWLAFGTAAAMVVEDDDESEPGYRLDPMTVGEYLIADDARGRVDTCYRHFTMTVGQLGEEFGIENLSTQSAHAYALEQFDTPVDCVHAIEPDRDGRNPHGEHLDQPWRSVYYELAGPCDRVLAVRGYDKFPVLVWRSGKLPGSAYGYGRGHDVLPHLVRLRRLIYRYGQALAFKSEPPVQMPSGMQAHEVKMLPGGKTSVFGQQPITNLMRVEIELREVAEEIERTRQDIRDTLGATLVASLRRISRQMTAREADLRKSEDLTEFMPGLGRLNEELLSPYVEWLWKIAESRGTLSPPPQSLEGRTIDIEFTSPLALEQRRHEANAIVRTWAIAGEMAKVIPEVVDHLDPAAIRRIAQIEGAPSSSLVPIEQVRQIQAARAQRDQAAATAASAQHGAELARTVGEANQLAVA